MSEKVQPVRVPSNEEIVDELIKDLNINESEGGDNKDDKESHCESPKNPDESIEKQNEASYEDIPEDFEKEEISKDPFIIDDIDEEELKRLEETVTEEEKESRRKQALDFKQAGNEEFKAQKYLESINNYTKALNICPLIYSNDRSIFYCNRAASKMKLERNDLAIDDCTKAIALNSNYVKAYSRRAKLYEIKEKLDECLEDYKKILELDPGNAEARAACMRLPPMINERNEKLKTEMLGKLKDLGNMILKPFGLSTDNFQLQQDPNSGGYSVNFQQSKRS